MDESKIVPATEFVDDRERQLPPDTRPLAADMARVGDRMAAAAASPTGEPSLDYTVRAIFDSRFPNTQDFNIPVSFVDEGDVSQIFLTFTVPKGSVCVLREIHHWFEDPTIIPFTKRSDVKMTIIIDKISVQYNQLIPVGVESDVLVKGFVIADEDQVVGIRLDLFDVVNGVTAWAHFYGNFIAKTGRPAQFEIANPGMGGPANVAPFMPYVPAAPVQVPAYIPPPPAPVAPTPTPSAIKAPSLPARRVTFAAKRG